MKCHLFTTIRFILFISTLCAYADSSKVKLITLHDIQTSITQEDAEIKVINLWATWCPPCVAELPHFENIHKKYDKKKLKFYLISIEGKEAKDKVESFLQKRQISCPVYLLEEGKPEDLEKVINTHLTGALPVTILYDSKGKIIRKFEEPITESILEQQLTELGLTPVKHFE